jgi:predicted TIM-barrel fold metal-dependent hydrolase
VQDAVASWVCHGGLFRNPELKVAVIENGASWLVPLLDQLADVYKKAPEGFLGDPVKEITTRIAISPFWEEDLKELSGIIGVDNVLFGSDWPHPEGLADPVRYVDEVSKMTEDEQAKVMGGNLARLLGV